MDLVVASGVAGPVRPIEIGGIVLAEVVLPAAIAQDLAAIGADENIRVSLACSPRAWWNALSSSSPRGSPAGSTKSSGRRMPWTIVSGQTIRLAPAAAAAWLLAISSSKMSALALKLRLTEMGTFDWSEADERPLGDALLGLPQPPLAVEKRAATTATATPVRVRGLDGGLCRPPAAAELCPADRAGCQTATGIRRAQLTQRAARATRIRSTSRPLTIATTNETPAAPRMSAIWIIARFCTGCGRGTAR